jgi:hypothetical protein
MLNTTFRPSFYQQDHVELLEKLDLLQSKMMQEVGVAQPNSIQRQLQDDVGICLLKLGRLVIACCTSRRLLRPCLTVSLNHVCSCSLVVHDCAERWESRCTTIAFSDVSGVFRL